MCRLVAWELNLQCSGDYHPQLPFVILQSLYLCKRLLLGIICVKINNKLGAYINLAVSDEKAGIL